MTHDEATEKAVLYWLAQARECLTSASDEARAGRRAFAVNLCYYAAFYAASAVLLARGRRVVKPGTLAEEWGRFYDRLFHDRQQGDYVEFVAFEDLISPRS